MVSKNSLYTIKCSEKIKNILDNDLKRRFAEHYPEYEGTKITQNQILTFALKRLYLDDWFKFDDKGNRHD